MDIWNKIILGINRLEEIAGYFYRVFRAAFISSVFSWNHIREKKNLIFEITSPADFWNVEPIWSALRGRKNMRIYWSVLNDGLTQISWPEYLEYLERQGIKRKTVMVSHVTPKVRGADLHLSPVDWSSRIPRGDIPRVQIFHYLPMKYSMHDKMLNFNALFFTGPPHLELYQWRFLRDHPGAEKRQAVFKVGYPKSDALIRRDYDIDEIKSRLGLDLSRPTVLYSPTWDKGAALRTFGSEVIKILAGLEVNVVVKLHQMSLYPPEHTHGTGGVDWRQELGRLKGDFPNVFPVFDHNCNPCLVISDVMVTDVSGIAYEYALLDRPLIFIDVPEYLRENPESDVARLRDRIGITIKSPDELPAAVERALSTPAEFSPRRREFIDHLLYNPGRATEVAVELIDQFLTEGVKVGESG